MKTVDDQSQPSTAAPAAPVLTAALLTGASSGIGLAMAHELARRGRAVTLVARRADRLREIALDISRTHGVAAEWIACDVADAADRDRLVAEIASRGLTVDLLVNNAGVGTRGRFHELPAEDEIGIVRINVEAMVALCSAFVPAMVERGRGAVLNVASSLAFQPVPHQATYSASKAFVLTFTETLTVDLHGTGVTATALCPGPVKTSFGGLIEESPGAFFVPVEEVARAAIDGVEAGRRTVMPGAANRAGAVVGRHLPRAAFLPLARRFWPV